MSVGRAIPLAIGIALGAGALLFAALNRNVVDINFFFFRIFEIPLWTIVLVSLLLGWAIPRLFRIRVWFRHARERSRLKRRIRELEKEVVELRNIPLDLDEEPEPRAAQKPAPVRMIAVENSEALDEGSDLGMESPPKRSLPRALPQPEEVEAELLTER